MTTRPGGSTQSPLWWVPAYPPEIGGIETFAATVAPALGRYRPDLLVSRGGPSDMVIDGVRVIRADLLTGPDDSDAQRLFERRRRVSQLKSELRPSLYHLHLADANPLLHLSTLSAAPAPTVTTVHNETHGQGAGAQGRAKVMRRLMEASTIITAVSPTVGRRLATEHLDLAHRFVTIPNGIDSGPDPSDIPPEPAILAVGRLTEQKGFDRLIAAMPDIVAMRPDATLTIVGSGPDADGLHSQIAGLGLEQHVRIVGGVQREAVAAIMSKARVIVTPSRWEGLCLVAVEAGAAGRPVVATDVAGLDRLIETGANGFLVSNDEAESTPNVLAKPVVELLNNDNLATRMGATARARAVHGYSLDACAHSYRTLYDALLRPAADIAVILTSSGATAQASSQVASIRREAHGLGASAQITVGHDGGPPLHPSTASSGPDARHVIEFQQPSLGLAAARNAGLALSSGELVVFGDLEVWSDRDLVRTLEQRRGAGRGGSSPNVRRREEFEQIGGYDPFAFDPLADWLSRAEARPGR
ncbi:MAG: glycosyltransferase [Actinomycetota bacterium]